MTAAGGAAEDGPGAVADAETEEASGVMATTDRSILIPKPVIWWNKPEGKLR